MIDRLFHTASTPRSSSSAAFLSEQRDDDDEDCDAETALLIADTGSRTGLEQTFALSSLGPENVTQATPPSDSDLPKSVVFLPRASSAGDKRASALRPSVREQQRLLPAERGPVPGCHSTKTKSKLAKVLDAVVLPMILMFAVAYVFLIGFFLGVHWEVGDRREEGDH
jgi:hypothetical protein